MPPQHPPKALLASAKNDAAGGVVSSAPAGSPKEAPPIETTNDMTPLKIAHLRYRRRPDEKDSVVHDWLEEMIDFSRPAPPSDGAGGRYNRGTIIAFPLSSLATKMDNDNVNNNTHDYSKSECYYTGPVFGLSEFPGFFMAPQALSKDLQQRLAHAAVTTYCEGTHATNIQGLKRKPNEIINDESMWDLWKQENYRYDASCCDGTKGGGTKKNKRARSSLSQSKKYYRSFQKLSWATMGYHYDWTERCYHRHVKSPMPTEMQQLGELFAQTAFLLSKDCKQQEKAFSYTASASIVNYYNCKSNMGGHRDDLELALDKPIVSVSVGQAAVFLLGGQSKQDEPVVPIVVRPGDVIIMGGESRLNYHSMCRLVSPGDLPAVDPARGPRPDQEVSVERIFSDPSPLVDSLECEALGQFLATHRININLRQVYPDDVPS